MAFGPTLDSLDSLDSDQGPNLMHLMHRKWHPGLSIQTPPPTHVPLILMNLIDLMHLKSWPWGATLHALPALASAQALTLLNLLNLKSWPWGADFRFIRFTRLMRMHSMRRLRRGLRGGGDLDLRSRGHCRCIRPTRFGPGSESNASTASKVAPRTFDSDTTPDAGASAFSCS